MATMKTRFTLIELLVVVSIIAVLASLLLPVLSNARASAKQTTCMSQERQISLALVMYAQDNDANMPSVLRRSDNKVDQNQARWAEDIFDYIGMKDVSGWPAEDTPFICPSANPRYKVSSYNCHYGISTFISSDYNGPEYYSKLPLGWRKAEHGNDAKGATPSNTFMLFDNVVPTPFYWGHVTPGTMFTADPQRFGHKLGFNLMLVDGHGERVRFPNAKRDYLHGPYRNTLTGKEDYAQVPSYSWP